MKVSELLLLQQLRQGTTADVSSFTFSLQTHDALQPFDLVLLGSVGGQLLLATVSAAFPRGQQMIGTIPKVTQRENRLSMMASMMVSMMASMSVSCRSLAANAVLAMSSGSARRTGGADASSQCFCGRLGLDLRWFPWTGSNDLSTSEREPITKGPTSTSCPVLSCPQSGHAVRTGLLPWP